MLCWTLADDGAAQTFPLPVSKGRGRRFQMGTIPVQSPASTATVPTHEGVAPDWVEHLGEGQGPHRNLTGTLHLEARLLVEGNQEVFAHEHSTADVGQAAEVLQVAPHQNGAFALLAEGPVHGQDVDVHCGPVRLV